MHILRMWTRGIACAFLGAAVSAASAQQTTLVNPDETGTAGAPEAGTATISARPVTTERKALTARWLDLKTFSHAERYRNTYNQGGVHLFESGQQRSLLEGRVKLDAQARYTIGFRASSGHYFNWAFADYAGRSFSHSVSSGSTILSFTPAEGAEIYHSIVLDPEGTNTYTFIPSNGWYFYMRELYVSATPVKPVTVEFGSFGFERGFATEITTFDDDGYLAGERIRVHDAKHLFVDEVGYTNAFFGDVGTPNFFARGSSLKESNYRQVFAKKQINARIGFSGDYTWQIGTKTTREAAVLGIEETRVVDKVRVELYQRLNNVTFQGADMASGNGFAVALEKKAGKRVSGDVGFASIDPNYTAYAGSRFAHAVGFALNGDTYGLGKRPFAHASLKLTDGVTAFGFYTHAVGAREITFNKQGLNAGLNFDFKALINKEKKVF